MHGEKKNNFLLINKYLGACFTSAAKYIQQKTKKKKKNDKIHDNFT